MDKFSFPYQAVLYRMAVGRFMTEMEAPKLGFGSDEADDLEMIGFLNSEGYSDPTAYAALNNAYVEQVREGINRRKLSRVEDLKRVVANTILCYDDAGDGLTLTDILRNNAFELCDVTVKDSLTSRKFGVDLFEGEYVEQVDILSNEEMAARENLLKAIRNKTRRLKIELNSEGFELVSIDILDRVSGETMHIYLGRSRLLDGEDEICER